MLVLFAAGDHNMADDMALVVDHFPLAAANPFVCSIIRLNVRALDTFVGQHRFKRRLADRCCRRECLPLAGHINREPRWRQPDSISKISVSVL